MIAFCWRSGLIGFGSAIPDGALKIAEGPSKKLRELIGVVSRHAYNGKDLLVPGIPEADSEEQAADALEAFIEWIKPSVEKIQEGR
jgi:hypothetical protein